MFRSTGRCLAMRPIGKTWSLKPINASLQARQLSAKAFKPKQLNSSWTMRSLSSKPTPRKPSDPQPPQGDPSQMSKGSPGESKGNTPDKKEEINMSSRMARLIAGEFVTEVLFALIVLIYGYFSTSSTAHKKSEQDAKPEQDAKLDDALLQRDDAWSRRREIILNGGVKPVAERGEVAVEKTWMDEMLF